MSSRSPRAAALAAPARVPALMLALALLLGACSSQPPSPAPDAAPTAPAPSAEPTSLDDLDPATMRVPRAYLCAGLPAAAVEAALLGEPRRVETWADGEQARLTDRVRDVAHEGGCRFDGPSRTSAAAWVFAPPVAPQRADELAAAATSGDRGCREVPDTATYGDPSVARTCRTGPLRETRYAGLVGDAWLTCSLSAPRSVDRADLEARADAWCAAVLLGAAPDQTSATG
ncbi:hypothetical protein QWJ41_03020 [Nocardioides sp. SOB44]|uniref:DUF3558 domain-containing protein n=1 Tax=Nocardioides cremeus TaxID=3058044 RepID=A0ABT8TMM2_9ACTN|nr:hypothetical protein [Nocardioides cremeus]MDO3394680.1 hypothetical protein [Nocardioides cremeus]